MSGVRAAATERAETVWALARHNRSLLVVGTVLGLVGVAASLAQPYAIGELIKAAAQDSASAAGAAGDGAEGRSLTWAITLLVVLFCVNAGFSAAQAYLIGRAGENIVFDVRRFLVGRLLGSELAAFSRHQQGDLLTRTVTDTSMVKIALSQSLAQLVINGFTVVGGVALMFWLDVWLMLMTLGCLGAASAVSLGLARRLRKVAVRNREQTGEFGSDLHRALSALPTVKASRAEPRELRRIGELADRARQSGIKVGALNALLTPAMNVGLQVSLAVVVGTGMTRVARGSMSMADLTAFVMYLFQLVSPLVTFFMSLGQFQQGRAAVDRIDELSAIPQEGDGAGVDRPASRRRRRRAGGNRPAADAAGGTPRRADQQAALLSSLAQGHHALEFQRVGFTYEGAGKGEALRDVSFTVPPSGLTAIVGPSGAGKTTLFQLVERFYEVDSGSILVCGQDAASLPLDTVRGLVGYVQQDSAAMRGTIRENLTYANPYAGEADLLEAVAAAGLSQVIEALPQGLDTELGDQGSGLSGGQRQRLCIARTLLQKPAVILLDEATSNLDSDSERDFRDAMRRVSSWCAVIAIAHRISTVVDAEKIVVMKDGRVHATGVHRELMAYDHLYRRLAGSQLNAGSDPAGPPVPRASGRKGRAAGAQEETLTLRRIPRTGAAAGGG